MGGCSGRENIRVENSSLYDITVEDINNQEVSLNDYRGEVMLIVNVASRCGLAEQNYRELVQLHNKYNQKGLKILAFPCNQFLWQELNDPDKIKSFAANRGVEFKILSRIEVNGINASPIYKYLRKYSDLQSQKIGWNFGKFLVNRQGVVYKYYSPKIPPLSLAMDIEMLLDNYR